MFAKFVIQQVRFLTINKEKNMKKKIILPIAALAVCSILCGCVSAPPPEACDLET